MANVTAFMDEDGDVHVAGAADVDEARAAAERARLRDGCSPEEWPDLSGEPHRWWSREHQDHPDGDPYYPALDAAAPGAQPMTTWHY